MFLTDNTGAAIDAKWFGEGSVRYGLAVGYINHDGVLDVVMNDGDIDDLGPRWTSRITVAMGNGDGTFAGAVTLDLKRPDETDGAFRHVTVGDLDHDSHPDILTGNGALIVNHEFGVDVSVEPQWFEPTAWDDALIADVTGDGLNDFPECGIQRMWIQRREDGVSIDQIVLSAETYRTMRPGSAKNDTTILQPTDCSVIRPAVCGDGM